MRGRRSSSGELKVRSCRGSLAHGGADGTLSEDQLGLFHASLDISAHNGFGGVIYGICVERK